jgi:hypothetical protein
VQHRSRLRIAAGILCAVALAACGGGGASDDPGTPAVGGSPTTASTSPSVDPITVARLDGLYDVTKTIVEAKNFSDITTGDRFKRTYDVTLECDTGPCDGTVVVDAEETKQNATQDVIFDASTATYAFEAPQSAVVCTGTDGKQYDLKTTNSFTLTPTKIEADGDNFIVTKFTAEGSLKAVPIGAAKSKGGCLVSTAEYTYVGHLA